ncbi:hypothetical protein BBJ28_00009081 [Nothophytophthora sp. Chile5]|nr:hypothetical protein BBJ28_00009081 [Nothophytophthora sp. Chile5]
MAVRDAKRREAKGCRPTLFRRTLSPYTLMTPVAVDASADGDEEVRPPSLIAGNQAPVPVQEESQLPGRETLESDAFAKAPDDEDAIPMVPPPINSPCSSTSTTTAQLGSAAAVPGHRVVAALLRAPTAADRKSQVSMSIGVLVLSLSLGASALCFHEDIYETTDIQSGLMLGSAGSLTMCAVVIGSYLRTKWYRRHMHILLLNLALCECFLALSFLLEPAWHRLALDGPRVPAHVLQRLDDLHSSRSVLSGAFFCHAILPSESTASPLVAYDHDQMTDPFTSPRMNRRKYQVIAHSAALASAVVMYVSNSFGSPVAVGDFCWVGADTQARSEQISNTHPSGSTTGIWVFIVIPAAVSMSANLYVTLVSYGRFREGVAATLRNRRGLLREGFLTTVTLIAYSGLLWAVYGAYWLTPSPTQAQALARLFAFLLSYRGSVPFILWCLYKRPQRKKKMKAGAVVDGSEQQLTQADGVSDKKAGDEEGEDEDTEVEDDDAVRPQMNLALLDELVFYTTQGIAKAVRLTSTLEQQPATSPLSTPPEQQEQYEQGPAQYSFTLQRSPETSAWNDYRFTAYQPLAFQRIRRFFDVNEDEYLSSLEACTTPKLGEGASGSFVFYSTDRSYIVKSLTATEGAFLHNMLDAYSTYLEGERGDSFLTRFLGSYCLELYGRPTHFVVMENVFDVQQGISIHQRYDIKGSWVDRNAQKPRRGAEATCRHCNLSFRCGGSSSRSSSVSGDKERRNICRNRAGAPHEPNVVLKDMDLTMKLRFGKNAGRKLLAQLMRDSDFLCARGVTDYSLLLGVIEVSYLVNRQNILTRDGSVFLPPDSLTGKEPHQDEDRETTTGSSGRVKQSTQCLRAAEVVIGPGFYYIGMIDMLQTWNFEKRVERFVKTVLLRKDPDGISAMPPKAYRDRFHRKLREIIHLGHNSSMVPPAPATVEAASNELEKNHGETARGGRGFPAGFDDDDDDYDRMTRIRPRGVGSPVECTASSSNVRDAQLASRDSSGELPPTPSYYGVYQSTYDQDLLFGVPFAQPPVGDLRWRNLKPLNSTWADVKHATSYSPECYGYGSDTYVLVSVTSEDCLTLNVVCPSGISEGADLSVAVWIFGGGVTEGDSADPRCNLAYNVDEAPQAGKPSIGVSLNHRLQAFGFLRGTAVEEAGVADLGLKDQRLALQWVRDSRTFQLQECVDLGRQPRQSHGGKQSNEWKWILPVVMEKQASDKSVAAADAASTETTRPLCSPKRRRSGDTPPGSGSGRKRRRSTSQVQDESGENGMRDGTLRIVTEVLRSENRQLQADRDALETEKKALVTRLAQSQRGFRDLEDDVARIYRQKQKEVDAQRLDYERERQELRDQLQEAEREKARQRMALHHGNVTSSRGNRVPVTCSVAQQTEGMVVEESQLGAPVYSEQTVRAMDAHFESCFEWQARLTRFHGKVTADAEKLEQQEVQAVMRDLVTSVELSSLREDVQMRDEELHWAQSAQCDAAVCISDTGQSQQETEEFAAMEKQLLDDRVVELETQLTQKRAVEHEKETELSSLRAEQEELLRSSHVMLKNEWTALQSEKEQMTAELQQLRVKTKQQIEQLALVNDERASLKLHNHKLLEEARLLREQQETRAFEVMEQSMAQDEEIKKLQVQLQAAKVKEAQTSALLDAAGKDSEKNRQRKDELKILYAKFSSTMDDVAEKTMKIEELQQQLEEKTSNSRGIQEKRAQLEDRVSQLQQQNVGLEAAQRSERGGFEKNLVKLQQRNEVLTQEKVRQEEWANKMRAKVTQLEAQFQALKDQQEDQVRHCGEHAHAGEGTTGELKRRKRQRVGDNEQGTASDKALLLHHEAEKETLQLFIQRYYPAAEAKCSQLLQQVGELDARNMLLQQQTRKSCDVLRMCVQCPLLTTPQSLPLSFLEDGVSVKVDLRRWLKISKEDDKAPICVGDCHHSRPALNSARSPPLRSEDEGLDFPADIIAFSRLTAGEDGDLLVDGVLSDVERSLHQKNAKTRGLKAEKRRPARAGAQSPRWRETEEVIDVEQELQRMMRLDLGAAMKQVRA